MKHTFAIALLLLIASIGCHSEIGTATSVDEFSSLFRTAYDNGDKDAIENMFDWTDVDNEVRDLQLVLKQAMSCSG